MFLATKGLMKDKITETKPIHVQELGKNESPERLSFLTHISHGIRTPLNAIMGYSKLMVLKNMGDIKCANISTVYYAEAVYCCNL